MSARGLVNDAEDVVQKLNGIKKPQSGAPGFVQWRWQITERKSIPLQRSELPVEE